MVVVPKYQVEDIDASLGTGTHPGFIVNEVEKSEILIGQHIGALLNDELVSQPGRAVKHTYNHDQFIAAARANGPGWHIMTNAEWAAVALWCWGNGFQPRGNTQEGRSSDVTDEYGVLETGRAHTTGADPGFDARTLTGSGPMSWRHDNSPFGIADLCGNVWEWTPGMRIVDAEIQILADNDAAADTADLSATGAAWKAIDATDGSLVAPGSANTVHYATSGTGNYTLVRNSGSSFEGMTNPGSSPVSAAALQLCKQHLLYPIASSGLGGDGFYITTTGERVPIRGGHWGSAALAGVFTLNLNNARSDSYTSVGARPAFVA
jgi:hypothetical protein